MFHLYLNTGSYLWLTDWGDIFVTFDWLTDFEISKSGWLVIFTRVTSFRAFDGNWKMHPYSTDGNCTFTLIWKFIENWKKWKLVKSFKFSIENWKKWNPVKRFKFSIFLKLQKVVSGNCNHAFQRRYVDGGAETSSWNTSL